MYKRQEQPNKEVPQFDEHFVEQIQQVNGIENVDVQKTVWAGIDFDETALEGFMKIQYEDSKYKSKGQSYEQTIEAVSYTHLDVYKRQVLMSVMMLALVIMMFPTAYALSLIHI